MNIKTNQMREFRESEKIVYISVRVTYSTLKVTNVTFIQTAHTTAIIKFNLSLNGQ